MNFKLTGSLFLRNPIKQKLNQHKFKNSIQRSIITSPNCGKSNKNYEYELRLDVIDQIQEYKILRYILDKKDLNGDDRNTFKRIMLLHFEDWIINLIDKQIIKQVRIHEYKNGISLKGEKQAIYFLLKGKIRFNNIKNSRDIQKNSWYGHQQILVNIPISQLFILSDSIFITINSVHFIHKIKLYYLQFIQKIQSQLPHQFIIYNSFYKNQFILSLQKHTLKPNHIVTSPYQNISYLYIITKGIFTNQNHDSYLKKYKVIGLKEILHHKHYFQHLIYSETQIEFYKLKVSLFQQYIQLDIFNSKFKLRDKRQNELKQQIYMNSLKRHRIVLSKKQRRRRFIQEDSTQRVINSYLDEKRQNRNRCRFVIRYSTQAVRRK